jgi:hypothetical protein
LANIAIFGLAAQTYFRAPLRTVPGRLRDGP